MIENIYVEILKIKEIEIQSKHLISFGLYHY